MKLTTFRVHWSVPGSAPTSTEVRAASPAEAGQIVRREAQAVLGVIPTVTKVKVDRSQGR